LAKLVIEDSLHDERHGEFDDAGAAIAELSRRARIPWNQDPNLPPCDNWRACGRRYELIEYDDSQEPWKELRRVPVLDVTAAGAKWLTDVSQIGSFSN
jgi:hypothetical protein